LRQRQLAGGALQQAHPKVGLEFGNTAREARLGMPSARPAAAKPPRSTTSTKYSMSLRSTMHISLESIELIFGTIYRIFADLLPNLNKSTIYPIAIQNQSLFCRNAASGLGKKCFLTHF
jgi:hypothetical protein